MKDYILRATAGNGQIRAFFITSSETAEAARRAHNTSPVVTAALGRLLAAGAMMGAMLKGEDLITLQLRGDGPLRGLTVSADAQGKVKGYAEVPQVMLPARKTDHKLDVGGAVGRGSLRVIRDLGLREPYIGETELISGEIAEDIAYYYAQSEQTPTALGLGVLLSRENIVSQAGGFLIQLMPEAEEEMIQRLEENLKRVPSVTDFYAQGGTPETMMDTLLEKLNPELLEKHSTGFVCDCSPARIERALISVGKKELMEMISEGREIEMRCHFCNKAYLISVEKLKELYAQA